MRMCMDAPFTIDLDLSHTLEGSSHIRGGEGSRHGSSRFHDSSVRALEFIAGVG